MATLEEDDFSLIHALQIRPRASWTDLAAALGTSPTTLSRRWERLRAIPGVRQVVGLPGPTNLLIGTWTRSAESAMLLHERLQRELWPLKVVESAIVLRQTKRLGWKLDELGRSTGTLVPYPPSTDRTSHGEELSRLQE